MNLIPESNGLYKVKHKHSFNGISKTKYLIFIIIAIILFAFISQQISNFIGNETIEISMNYAKVEGKKMEYSLKGEGDYTVVFIGATGVNLYEWNEIAKYSREELKLKTFVYNRNGYGFSDISSLRTPSEQADDLKILLRKSGVSGSVILVGEEYGSLVATNFAKNYPDVVKGMVLVDPYDEEKIKTEDFKKEMKKIEFNTRLQQYGCYFNLTSLLDRFNKTYTVNGFEESLGEDEKKEFQIKKNKVDYRKAIANEYSNLANYNDTSMTEGVLDNNKPLYIITDDESTNLTKMANSDYTSVYVTDCDKLLSINSSDTVENGISIVLKDIKKIAKKEKNNQI